MLHVHTLSSQMERKAQEMQDHSLPKISSKLCSVGHQLSKEYSIFAFIMAGRSLTGPKQRIKQQIELREPFFFVFCTSLCLVSLDKWHWHLGLTEAMLSLSSCGYNPKQQQQNHSFQTYQVYQSCNYMIDTTRSHLLSLLTHSDVTKPHRFHSSSKASARPCSSLY